MAPLVYPQRYIAVLQPSKKHTAFERPCMSLLLFYVNKFNIISLVFNVFHNVFHLMKDSGTIHIYVYEAGVSESHLHTVYYPVMIQEERILNWEGAHEAAI